VPEPLSQPSLLHSLPASLRQLPAGERAHTLHWAPPHGKSHPAVGAFLNLEHEVLSCTGTSLPTLSPPLAACFATAASRRRKGPYLHLGPTPWQVPSCRRRIPEPRARSAFVYPNLSPNALSSAPCLLRYGSFPQEKGPIGPTHMAKASRHGRRTECRSLSPPLAACFAAAASCRRKDPHISLRLREASRPGPTVIRCFTGRPDIFSSDLAERHTLSRAPKAFFAPCVSLNGVNRGFMWNGLNR
jgi:hypothetical protein